jgi:predicted secreted protein
VLQRRSGKGIIALPKSGEGIMFVRGLLVSSVLCLTSLPASAAVPAPAKPAAPAGRADPNQIICRREQVTGSLVQTRKICLTRADWAARSRNAREASEQAQQQGRISSCGSNEPGGC